MTWVVSIALLVILLLLGIWFLQKFYVKATLNSALVRTGLGGMRIVLDGGCISLPIIHQTQRVMMGAISFPSSRLGREALLTGDQLRADITMEFEFKVMATPQGVAAAAQSLGSRIERGGEAIEGVLSGPLIGAMQSDVSQFDEKNTFDAQGMRRHAELISEQRRERVRIETETEIAVRQQGLEKHQRQLEIQRTERETSIAQQEIFDRLEAEAQAKTREAKSQSELRAETARIDAEQKIQEAKVANDTALRRSEMSAILSLEETKIENETRLASLRTAEFGTQAAEEAARAQVLLAAEEVQAQKERAIAKREYETAQLRLQKDIDLSTSRTKSDAETLATRTQSEANAAKTMAEAELVKAKAEADGRAAHIIAENSMSEAQIRKLLEERRLDRMPEIMTQMMKPVEKIDSIRINQISGMGGQNATNTEGGAEGAFGAAMDQILGMAVRLPAMKQMGDEIGLDFDANLAGRTADYANRLKAKDDKK